MSDPFLDDIIKRDKLIVATFGTAPPFCYTDDTGNQQDSHAFRLFAFGHIPDILTLCAAGGCPGGCQAWRRQPG